MELSMVCINNLVDDYDVDKETEKKKARKRGTKPASYITVGYYLTILDEWTDAEDDEDDLYSDAEDASR